MVVRRKADSQTRILHHAGKHVSRKIVGEEDRRAHEDHYPNGLGKGARTRLRPKRSHPNEHENCNRQHQQPIEDGQQGVMLKGGNHTLPCGGEGGQHGRSPFRQTRGTNSGTRRHPSLGPHVSKRKISIKWLPCGCAGEGPSTNSATLPGSLRASIQPRVKVVHSGGSCARNTGSTPYVN